MSLESFSIGWKPKLGDNALYSPVFCLKNELLRLYFKKVDVMVNLFLVHKERIPDNLNVSVQVESAHTRRVLRKLSQKRRFTVTTQCSVTIWSETFQNIERADPDFVRDYRLAFRVTFHEDLDLQRRCTTDASVQTSLSTYAIRSLESFSDDFAKLLDTDPNPDVELQCGDTTTRAHKNVLCSRSPVLAKMLQSDMVEGKTGEVTIQNMDADIFQQFLRYLYTGKVDDALTFDTALSLYEAGDMYAVKPLVRHCSKFLIDSLTVENACDALAVADAHSDADFVEKVTAFILEKEIPVNSNLWSSFCGSHPILANTVLTRFCKALVELRKS